MTRRGRLFTLVLFTLTALAALSSAEMARSERSSDVAGQVVAQRIILPAPDVNDNGPGTAEPLMTKPSPARQAGPMVAEMATSDVRMTRCADGEGAKTRLGLLENTSMWDHCGDQ